MILNWNTDEQYLQQYPSAHKRWRLIQLLEYGGIEERISKKDLISEWEKIRNQVNIDTRKTIEYLLWGKKWQKELDLAPDRSNFWSWQRDRNISQIAST